MFIGVISDTHNETELTRRAIRLFESFEVEAILHCGDVGALIPPLFSGFNVYFVRGNTDHSADFAKLPSEKATLFEEVGKLEIAGKKIAFLHGDDFEKLNDLVGSNNWDMVCYGHTHHRSSRVYGKTLALNPGAISRSVRPSVAVVDLETMQPTIIEVL